MLARYFFPSQPKPIKIVIGSVSPEHAREILPNSLRQDCMIGRNLMVVLHFLDLRLKANAQAEIIHLAESTYKIMCMVPTNIRLLYRNQIQESNIISIIQ